MPNRNSLTYAAAIILVVVILAVAYLFFRLNTKREATFNILNNKNLSNSTFNRTQLMLLQSLKKSLNASSLHVTYFSSMVNNPIPTSNNLTLVVSENQTIDSYHLGNYNKTVYRNVVSYTNARTGKVLARNVSSTYYYETNVTITCFNQTSTDSNGNVNSNLQCSNGIAGQNYLESFPFTASNVSMLGILITEGNLTYGGTKNIANRECDNFLFSNVTQNNLLANYSVINLCIDSKYGIPLYVNETDVTNGMPNSTAFIATYFTTNVSMSDFSIPQSYLNSIPKSVI